MLWCGAPAQCTPPERRRRKRRLMRCPRTEVRSARLCGLRRAPSPRPSDSCQTLQIDCGKESRAATTGSGRALIQQQSASGRRPKWSWSGERQSRRGRRPSRIHHITNLRSFCLQPGGGVESRPGKCDRAARVRQSSCATTGYQTHGRHSRHTDTLQLSGRTGGVQHRWSRFERSAAAVRRDSGP